MISAGDFRNGITLEIEGNVFQIMEFQHVKPGKGAAFVRTKIKNVMSGGVVERTFRPTEKFPAARIDRVDMQYLYSDGDQFSKLCISPGILLYNFLFSLSTDRIISKRSLYSSKKFFPASVHNIFTGRVAV